MRRSSSIPPRAQAILDYWHDLGPAGWYAGGAELDAEIRARFEADWHAAMAGQLADWTYCARTQLAFLILTDQFPRNMFRDSAQAFASDPLARRCANHAWQHESERAIAEPERQFFYLPLMHSEYLLDQDRCVALFATRMPETGAQNLLHARAHREVIRRFGRFPYRNAALGRENTPAEDAFFAEGGYPALVKSLAA